jgi:hypothetical protein
MKWGPFCFEFVSLQGEVGSDLVLWAQGYISTEEFMSIPELSINPLQKRMEHMFENVNFKVPPPRS